MDEFTKLINKIDFDKFFDIQLARYGVIIEEARKEGQWKFDDLVAAKQIFKDQIFQWFIKKINEPLGVITQENIIEVFRARVWLQHSRENKAEHTCVPNDVLERLLNVISRPDSMQNNTCAKVSPSGKS